MSDPIRAALDKARAVYCHADGECPCATSDDCSMNLRSDVPEKIIAAFLRAVNSSKWPRAIWLADAVIAAAKGDQK